MIKGYQEKFASQQKETLIGLEDFLKTEQRDLKDQLTQLRQGETQLLKDKVANKLNALVLSNLQTSVRGAMGSSLLDRQRLGLLKYKRGTVGGEALRMMLQYTSTLTGMFLNTYDLHNAANQPKGASLALDHIKTPFLTTMILAGIGTAIIKALLRGEDISVSGVLEDAVLKNGALLPYYGRLSQLLDGGMASALLGPAPSTGIDLVKAAKKSIFREKNAGIDTARAVRNALPFMNLWYTKTAFDHLIYNQILETLNPGYLAKQQPKKEKHGVGFFQDKDEFAPHRLPEVRG